MSTQAQELQDFYNSLGSYLDYYLLGGVPNPPEFDNDSSENTYRVRLTGSRTSEGERYEYYDPYLGRYVEVYDTRP
jgi:hypothetical protein